MKKPVIKKTKTNLKMVLAGFLASLVLFVSTLGFANLKFSEYSDDNSIEDMADDLDCDMGYISQFGNHFVRMEHNNKEPIYVCLDEELTDKEKESAIKTLDYMFGIVGTINENYTYKIVSKSEYFSKVGKSKIYYKLGTLKSEYEGQEFKSNGYIMSIPNLVSFLTAKRTRNNFIINIDRDQIAKSESEVQLEYTLLHELMHAFGFKDVYTVTRLKETDKYQGNTYINSSLDEIGMLTPNDVKCLISLYSQDDTEKDRMYDFLEAYSNNYYQNYTEVVADKYGKIDDFNEREIEIEGGLRVTKEDGSQHGYIYQVNIEDDKYEFRILDYFSNELLDSCSGDIVYANGMAILKDIELKTGMRPYDSSSSYSGGFVQDLVVGYLGKYKKQLTLYDYNTNWGINCQVLKLEKSIDR